MKAIIGLGNPLKGDDGIGVRLVREIEKRNIPSDIKVFDAGTRGMKILHLLNDLEEAIIIDAVHFGGDPGDSVFFTPADVKSLTKSQSTHDTDFLEVLELSKTLDEGPEKIVIMGVEPKDTSFGGGISSELEDKLPELIDDLFKKVMEVFGPGERQ